MTRSQSRRNFVLATLAAASAAPAFATVNLDESRWIAGDFYDAMESAGRTLRQLRRAIRDLETEQSRTTAAALAHDLAAAMLAAISSASEVKQTPQYEGDDFTRDLKIDLIDSAITALSLESALLIGEVELAEKLASDLATQRNEGHQRFQSDG